MSCFSSFSVIYNYNKAYGIWGVGAEAWLEWYGKTTPWKSFYVMSTLSFHKYLFSSYYVLGISLDTRMQW